MQDENFINIQANQAGLIAVQYYKNIEVLYACLDLMFMSIQKHYQYT